MGQEGYLKNKRLQHRKFNRLLYFEDFGQCVFATTTLERIQVVLLWHITSQLRSIGFANAATMTLKIILNGMLRR